MINSVTGIRRKVDETPVNQKVYRQVGALNCCLLVTRGAVGEECLSKDFVERQSGGNVVNLSHSTVRRWSPDCEERDGAAGKRCWRKRMLPCNGGDRATATWGYPSRKTAHFQRVFPEGNLLRRQN
jgi:hypothetical protein